ncbi:MAG: aspartate/glutamate racemase family protein [Chloroflexi bacterium]|nr:aspartate/glutamate racemase family protein [Chloroflexota bacterium]
MQNIELKAMPRVKLGVLVPSVNYNMEPDIYKMLPEGVTAHFQRVLGFSPAKEPFADPDEVARNFRITHENAVSAAQVLAIIEPKVIAYGCTSGSFYFGLGHDYDIVKRIEAATGIRAITTSTAGVEALKELGIKKMCLVTPYPEHVTAKGKEFFESNGFEVPAVDFLDISPLILHQQLPEVAYQMAVQGFRKGCEAVFISCTGIRAIEIIDRAEREMGVPVVTANQATLWLMLKEAGVTTPVEGFGELMRHL